MDQEPDIQPCTDRWSISYIFRTAATRDRVAQSIAGCVIVFSVALGASYSWVSGFAVLLFFVAGVISCILFRDHMLWLNSKLFSMVHEKKVVTPKSKMCSVCGNAQCNRHQPVTSLYHQTMLPEPVDQALQELLELILAKYIERWHSRISEDSGFEQQLRLNMQSAVSVLLHRFSQLDEVQLITDRLVPAAISHCDIILRNSNLLKNLPSSRNYSKINEEAAGKDNQGAHGLDIVWHPATLSRHQELSYLRHLTAQLMPYVLPPHHLNCRAWHGLVREILARWVLLPAMDLVCDGAVLLRLLAHLLDRTGTPPATTPSPPSVPTLRTFVSSNTKESTSCLRNRLTAVMHEPALLYPFMQFLKKVGAVHILQFCLDIEKFNDTMLNPELTPQQLSELYKEAWDLFSLYFLSSSPDCVGFSDEIVHQMKAVLEGGEKNIHRLRNTPPLFQAYDWAYSKLEQELLPLYHHSEEYFIGLCGGRLSKLKKKRPQHIRTDSQGVTWLEDASSAAYAPVREDVRDWKDVGQVTQTRNLSAWRVSVPRAYLRPEMPGSSRITAVMVIVVQRIDIHEEDDPDDFCWTLYRSHADFCALHSKLEEFHGEFDEVAGAPLKRPGTSGLEGIEAWRVEGEEYLQLLLRTPALQNSDLLGAFLSPHVTDFADVVGSSELSLSKVLRTVRLHRESGQHLEPFINNMLTASRRHTRPRKLRGEERTSSPQPIVLNKLNLNHPLFGDNLGQDSSSEGYLKSMPPSPDNCWDVAGVFDSVTYLVVRVLEAPNVVAQAALALRKLLRDAVDSVYQRRMKQSLHLALRPQVLAQLIDMLKDEINTPRGGSPRPSVASAAEGQLATVVLQLLEATVPWPVSRLPCTKSALLELTTALRTPILNKQLAYTLLDILTEELFPELK